MQGGASAQFAAVPLNLTRQGQTVDQLVTGSWSKKAGEEAGKYSVVNIAAKVGQYIGRICSCCCFLLYSHILSETAYPEDSLTMRVCYCRATINPFQKSPPGTCRLMLPTCTTAITRPSRFPLTKPLFLVSVVVAHDHLACTDIFLVLSGLFPPLKRTKHPLWVCGIGGLHKVSSLFHRHYARSIWM